MDPIFRKYTPTRPQRTIGIRRVIENKQAHRLNPTLLVYFISHEREGEGEGETIVYLILTALINKKKNTFLEIFQDFSSIQIDKL